MGVFTPSVTRLKRRGDLEGLVGLLGHQSQGVRFGAQAAIEDLRDPRSVDVLLDALREPTTTWVVGRMLAELGGSRAVEPLIAALHDPDPAMRVAAARVLGELGDSRAVEPLIAALGDQQVRGTAVVALDHLDDPRAIEALAGCMSDPDPMVSRLAWESLRRFGSRVGEVLQQTLTGDSLTDLPTLRTLANLGDKGGINGLLAIVADPSLDDDTRAATATFLRRHCGPSWGRTEKRVTGALDAFESDPGALRFLIDEFMGIDAKYVTRAGMALAERGDEALEPLLLAMGADARLARYRAVRPMTRDEARGLLLELTRQRLESPYPRGVA
jgi:HEAT repeat protein